MANLQSQTSEKFKQLLQYGVNHARAVAVDYINNAFSPNQNTDNNAKQTENNQMNLISNFESLLVELQSLLIWEKPYNSALSLLFFTCFYWYVYIFSYCWHLIVNKLTNIITLSGLSSSGALGYLLSSL